VINIAKNQSLTLDYKNLVLASIKEKYPYLLLGAAVILIILLFFTAYVSKNKIVKLPSTKQSGQPTENKPVNTSYIVKDGDTLWKISEDAYGSGYNAYDVAKANSIADANIISAGQLIVLPSVTPKQPTRGEIAIAQTSQVSLKEDSYTVKPGDYLWKIAVEAYGDGYMWVNIAKANNLTNPDFIFAGNVLKLPR
jgi:putative chitinase